MLYPTNSMARRIIPSFGCAIRRLTVSCEHSVVKSCRFSLLKRHTYQPLIAVRHCVTPVQSIKGLEEALTSLNLENILQARDEIRDVVVRGFPQTATVQDVHKFFEGVEIEELHTLESKKQFTKRLFYIRFKDADSLQKGLSKHKDNFGTRYIEVLGVKQNFDVLKTFVLRENSKIVLLRNIPFTAQVRDIRLLVEKDSIDVKEITFIKRGTCLVELGSSEQAGQVIDMSLTLEGRDLNSSSFLSSRQE